MGHAERCRPDTLEGPPRPLHQRGEGRPCARCRGAARHDAGHRRCDDTPCPPRSRRAGGGVGEGSGEGAGDRSGAGRDACECGGRGEQVANGASVTGNTADDGAVGGRKPRAEPCRRRSPPRARSDDQHQHRLDHAADNGDVLDDAADDDHVHADDDDVDHELDHVGDDHVGDDDVADVHVDGDIHEYDADYHDGDDHLDHDQVAEGRLRPPERRALIPRPLRVAAGGGRAGADLECGLGAERGRSSAAAEY
mmetsp:Transcript_302/g.1082  ORF Transcript_302/g.1082 Transcript_302/m.1082 type:complete len:252 (+) Transcript_302:588-1343(+)